LGVGRHDVQQAGSVNSFRFRFLFGKIQSSLESPAPAPGSLGPFFYFWDPLRALLGYFRDLTNNLIIIFFLFSQLPTMLVHLEMHLLQHLFVWLKLSELQSIMQTLQEAQWSTFVPKLLSIVGSLAECSVPVRKFWRSLTHSGLLLI